MRKDPNRPCTKCGKSPPEARFSTKLQNGKRYRESWCYDCKHPAKVKNYKSSKSVLAKRLRTIIGALEKIELALDDVYHELQKEIPRGRPKRGNS